MSGNKIAQRGLICLFLRDRFFFFFFLAPHGAQHPFFVFTKHFKGNEENFEGTVKQKSSVFCACLCIVLWGISFVAFDPSMSVLSVFCKRQSTMGSNTKDR